MKKETVRQFYAYFGAAGAGFVVDFLILIIFKELLGINYIVAAGLGFIGGIIVLYILGDKFVFKNPKISSSTKMFLLFVLIGLIGLAILSVLMWIFTDKLAINYIYSKLIATIFVYLWNFFARRNLYNN